MSETINSSILWILCGVCLAVVCTQTAIFIRKGWKASLEKGVDPAVLKKVVTSSILTTIVPTLPTLIVLLSLCPVLGQPLPWFRLSVIGSPGYESGVAAFTLSAFGDSMTVDGFGVESFAGVVAVATFASCIAIAFANVLIKPISMGFNKIKSSSIAIFSLVGVCCLTALTSSMAAEYGLANLTGFVVLIASMIAAIAVIKLSNKLKITNPKMALLKDFNLPIGIIVGLICTLFVA